MEGSESMEVGRPMLYTDENEMQKKIDKYFKSISRTVKAFEDAVDYEDSDGKIHFKKVPLIDDNGDQVEYREYFEKPTVTGLAIYIGMTRPTLMDYERNPQFSSTVKAGKARVEHYLEERLHGKDVTGTIFNLKNNFGWVDKQEVESVNTNLNYNFEAELEELTND